MTREAFELLLTRLDSDRQKAARKYEHIRKALHAYFEFHGSLSPAEQVDATIDRVALSLLEGKNIYIDNPAGFFYGVARNVLRQYYKDKKNKFIPLDDLPPAGHGRDESYDLLAQAEERSEHERRLECLERCLATLSEQNQKIIRRYYEGTTGVKINNRKNLAENLGISTNLLRVRAKRIRDRLEGCVEQCLTRDQAVI